MVIALRLANGSWWGGNPGVILEAPADEVMLAIQYENFKSDYEQESLNMAKTEAENES